MTRVALVGLGTVFLAAGCMSDSIPPLTATRFLALGDSYTIGEGVRNADCWPSQLAAVLRAEGVGVGEPQIVAETGWTVAELDAGLDAAAPDGPFGLVTLLVGVNDQYRGGDAETFQPAFRALLVRAVGFASGAARRVVVLSIPDWGVTPFAARSGFAGGRDAAGVARALDAFNAAARAEALAAGAHWVSVSDVSRAHGATEVAADGLHPSQTLYARWAALAEPAARAALAE